MFSCSMNMVKSRLLRHSTLGSTIIGVVLKEPGVEVMSDRVETLSWSLINYTNNQHLALVKVESVK